MGLVGNGWLVDWSARSEEIKVQRSGLRVRASHFFRGRSQFDDLIFRGLADDVFVERKTKRKDVKSLIYAFGVYKNNLKHHKQFSGSLRNFARFLWSV